MAVQKFNIVIEYEYDDENAWANPAAEICKLLLCVIEGIHEDGLTDREIELMDEDDESNGTMKVTQSNDSMCVS